VSTVPLTSMLIQPIAVDAAACCNGEDDCC
jgi:hypothetical protein